MQCHEVRGKCFTQPVEAAGEIICTYMRSAVKNLVACMVGLLAWIRK